MKTNAQRGKASDAVVSDVAAFVNQLNPNRARPVKLQVNTSGAWRDVIRFDASKEVESAEVMGAAETLGRISRCAFRVVVADEGGRSPLVLTVWAVDTGWKDHK